MYQSFEISNFRCLDEFSMTDLEQVNLIAGVNNVGKTTILEALFLHCGAYNPQLTFKLNAFRGIESIMYKPGQMMDTPWDSLFSEFDMSKEIKIVGDDKKTGIRTIRLKTVTDPEKLMKISQLIERDINKNVEIPMFFESTHVLELENESNGLRSYYQIIDQKGIRTIPIPPPPPFPTLFQGSRYHEPLNLDVERFSKLELEGNLDRLIESLQVIEPRLRDLSLIFTSGFPLIHGDIGLNRPIPLHFMGEGMVRFMTLLLAIGNSPNGVILIDEIENGLHHSVLQEVWKVVGNAAREFNTQVFATTHSLECIVGAHNAFVEDGLYDFSLHRLERINKDIRAVRYDQETLDAAFEIGLEVR